MTVEFPALALILLFPALGVVFNLFFGARCGTRRGQRRRTGRDVRRVRRCDVGIFEAARDARGRRARRASVGMDRGAAAFTSSSALRVDALSGVMVMIVTGVGALIHLYSVGYMAHDEDFARFFTYMNLFALSMLILILADNLLMMFVGWEGVGLCSYLLIAFWYTNPQFAYNGRKAFVVNRIGDAGFLLGMFTIVATLGAHGVWTLNFVELRNNAALLGGAARDRGMLPAVHRRDRQVGADSALRMAARRDGRPDSGQRADPCRDDGHRRRLHDRAARLHVHDGAQRARPGRDGWRADRAVRRDHRDRPARHQESARLLDHQPARLHVSRRRIGRVSRRESSTS